MVIELNDNERALIHKALLNYNLKKDLTVEEKKIITDLIVKIYK
jgi:hypothetical protein